MSRKPNGYWTEAVIRAEAAKYDKVIDFKKYASTAYQNACRLNIKDEVCSHMVKHYRPSKYTKEICAEKALMCSSRKEFQTRFPKEYEAACKQLKCIGEICSHMIKTKDLLRAKLLKYTPDVLKAIALRYKTLTEFKRNDEAAYQAARRDGLLAEITSHMVRLRKNFSVEEVFNIAKQYNSRTEFRRGKDKAAYDAARKLGILIEATAHMPNQYKIKTDNELAAIAKTFTSRHAFELGDKNSYAAAQRRGIIDKICAHMVQGYNTTDNDALYCWKAIGLTFNGKQVYKIGVTSARLGEYRVAKVAENNKVDYEVIFLLGGFRDARQLEKRCLAIGEDPEYTNSDGATEFRALSEAELNKVKAIAYTI